VYGKNYQKNGEKAGIEAANLAYQSLDFNSYTIFVGMMKKTPLDIVKMKCSPILFYLMDYLQERKISYEE
jgi:hypothetical protein